jgi:hypothetical protein
MIDVIGDGHPVLRRDPPPPRARGMSRALGWSLLWVIALIAAGAHLGGAQGAVAGLLAVLVAAITRFDAERRESTERRFVAEDVLLARPSIAVHAGWDLRTRRRCVMVMIMPGPRWSDRAREMLSQPSFRMLRPGERYAEGVTRDGRVLWVYEGGDSGRVRG